MTRCYVLVEGQTEEAFVNRVITPHLLSVGYYAATPVVIATKRSAGGGKYKGGVGSWAQVEREFLLLCRDGGATVTSMIDLYGLPAETPGLVSAPSGPPRARVEYVERAVGRHLDQPNLIPNIMLHEFETLLYADPELVGQHFAMPGLTTAMRTDVNECGEAEAVDDGPDTAPSKRIRAHVPGFLKATDGPTIAADIGLDRLRGTCPHFDGWISALESVAGS
jgi:hypothetical protein